MPRKVTLPPDVEEALRARDEGEPHRLTGFQFMGVLGGGVSHRPVPQEHFEAHDEYATVNCPCGHRPQIAAGRSPSKCECQRAFFYDGTLVWALNSPSVPGGGVH